jgi:extracellular elastinolytic metalloproteinase
VSNRRRLLCATLLGALVVGAFASAGGAATGGSAADDADIAFLTGPNAGEPVRIALDYLRQHVGDYGLSSADLADVVTSKSYVSRHNGVTHVVLQQRHQQVPVYAGASKANVARDGSIINLYSNFVGGLAGKVNTVEPVLSRQQAGVAAARALALSGTAAFRLVRDSGGPTRAGELSTGGISLSRIPISLVLEPTGDEVRLAWKLDVEEVSGLHWWNVRIDAVTGQLLARFDYGDAEAAAPAVKDGSSYRVYNIPKENPNDGPRTVQKNPSEAPASPFGWHDTNGANGAEFTVTRGNNTHSYIDTINDSQPDPGGEPNGGAGLDFKFPLDLSTEPVVYKLAATTNLFYWTNVIHDVFYAKGFDEASGNFQVNNYGRGGLGNDDVRGEAQDGSGFNNANFFTPSDGQRPRMQMYIWTGGTPRRDGDLDNGVIMHEYGHGISNRLTGDNVGCLNNAEQPGEGWSDWFAMVMTPRADDTGPTPRGMGTYVIYQQRDGRGIRPSQYTTDMQINPSTYDRIKSLPIPHGVGYVWASIIWEVYWNLVDEYGYNPDIYGDWTTGGNNLALQLVVDGLKLQPCSPGFVDARNAIIQADKVLTGGENKCLLWQGFAKRGLGKSAQQGSSSSTQDGTEAFDLPRKCR